MYMSICHICTCNKYIPFYLYLSTQSSIDLITVDEGGGEVVERVSAPVVVRAVALKALDPQHWKIHKH